MSFALWCHTFSFTLCIGTLFPPISLFTYHHFIAFRLFLLSLIFKNLFLSIYFFFNPYLVPRDIRIACWSRDVTRIELHRATTGLPWKFSAMYSVAQYELLISNENDPSEDFNTGFVAEN